MPHRSVVSREEQLKAQKDHLKTEKALRHAEGPHEADSPDWILHRDEYDGGTDRCCEAAHA